MAVITWRNTGLIREVKFLEFMATYKYTNKVRIEVL